MLLAAVVGCQSIGYYKQAFSGQMEMLSNQQPIPALIENPNTSPKLKEKFRLILALRQFAKTKLNLPTGNHYLAYVDLHRSNAVWNVYAAPELSLKPKSWWFPVVGSVSYRGYFSESAAQRYANKMRKKGLDVYVGGVDAYSTLGWFNDPVLNTFIDDSERRLAALIFHELAHQRLFISGDTDFNEAFATAVAEEGLRRWLDEKKDPIAFQKYQNELKRKKQFVDLIRVTRDRLAKIYETSGLAEPTSTKRSQKLLVLQKLRGDYAKLKQEWNGYDGYDDWFAGPLNNAQLNTVATYYDLVPAFHQLIHEDGGDLNKFFEHTRRFARMSKEQRHRTLAQLKVTRTNEFLASPEPSKKGADLAM
ncbi:MAG: aminopeptidase [Verrucomicrobiota bacterium]